MRSRSHYMEASFWRRLWTCRQTEYWMNELKFQPSYNPRFATKSVTRCCQTPVQSKHTVTVYFLKCILKLFSNLRSRILSDLLWAVPTTGVFDKRASNCAFYNKQSECLLYEGCSESKERLRIQPAQLFHCTRSVIWCVQ